MTAVRAAVAKHIAESSPMDQAATDTFADRPFSFCEYRAALWEIDTKLMEHHARLRRLSEQVQAVTRSVLVASGPAQMRQDCTLQPSLPSLQSEIDLSSDVRFEPDGVYAIRPD